MVKIKHIRIKNFRSIVSLDLDVNNMSIFVGLNDVGKSNVLKALNLFFNGETEPGHRYDFYVDYSQNAPKRVNKSKEVIIALTFEIPDKYMDNDDVVWEKVWRRKETPYLDEFKDAHFSAYSKVPTLLSRVRYRYVPAVKSDDYFRLLLADLYLAIASEANEELVEKSVAYSEALTSFTKHISELVEQSVGIRSNLMMPTNQKDIFKQLVFETSDDSENKVELSFRGDGIKAMHIPAILNFIANQDIKGLGKKAIPVTTIWGYEEPENGIEMKKCFELADVLYEFSSDIQQFITTHSPGIYQLGEKTGVDVFYVSKSQNYATIITRETEPNLLNERVGILPIVTPYIAEVQKEKKKLEEIIKTGCFVDCDTIFVEGVTDKFYIENAIKEISVPLARRLADKSLLIQTRIEGGCGTSVLCDWAKAWYFAGYKSKALFLFDNDEEGKRAADRVNEFKQQLKRSVSNFKAMKLEPTEDIKEFNQSVNNHLLFDIEHLLSGETLNVLYQQGMLVSRKNRELAQVFENVIDRHLSIDQMIEKYSKNDYLRMIVSMEPNDGDKMSIVHVVERHMGENYKGFINTVHAIEEYICK